MASIFSRFSAEAVYTGCNWITVPYIMKDAIEIAMQDCKGRLERIGQRKLGFNLFDVYLTGRMPLDVMVRNRDIEEFAYDSGKGLFVPKEVVEFLDLHEGENLFFVSRGEYLEMMKKETRDTIVKLLESYPWVTDIRKKSGT